MAVREWELEGMEKTMGMGGNMDWTRHSCSSLFTTAENTALWFIYSWRLQQMRSTCVGHSPCSTWSGQIHRETAGDAVCSLPCRQDHQNLIAT